MNHINSKLADQFIQFLNNANKLDQIGQSANLMYLNILLYIKKSF